MTKIHSAKFKDKIKNVEEQSLVVYNLKCRKCGVEYISKTERILCVIDFKSIVTTRTQPAGNMSMGIQHMASTSAR